MGTTAPDSRGEYFSTLIGCWHLQGCDSHSSRPNPHQSKYSDSSSQEHLAFRPRMAPTPFDALLHASSLRPELFPLDSCALLSFE